MSFSLINNLSSTGSQQRLSSTTSKLNQTLQRLSSGLRINKSGDDAAGLAIANSYRNDITTITQGVRNANDGVSTLQIIDGGLNTISGLLDRATTLAAQSASDTFTGNRDTLNSELTKVFDEITRQAENIGLGGASGTNEGRYNKNIGVYIGGGTDASAANNQVNLDLTNSRVDKTGLNLNNLNIGTGTGSVTGNQSLASGLATAETLTFQKVGSSGNLESFSIDLSAGASASNVVDTINNDANIQAAGIKAEIDTNNKLVLKSASLFTVSSSDADGANQTGIAGAGAAANDIAITSAVHSVTKSVGAATAAGSQTLSFSGDEIGVDTGSHSVSFTTSTTAATGASNAATAINSDTTLRSSGVFAVVNKANGSEVSFISLKSFDLAVSNDATAGANNNISSQSPTTAGAATLTGGVDGAKNAIEAIKSAISTLGTIQGKVGAGQNNLTQAIDLATSQLSNYQAAESAIRDSDIASEASNLARLTTLQQAGVSALAQANQSNQALLSLLR